MCYFIFFFFKQKTAYEMRISDWSSDVCSSDLINLMQTNKVSLTEDFLSKTFLGTKDNIQALVDLKTEDLQKVYDQVSQPAVNNKQSFEQKIGRASCRERVCQYV